MAMKSKPTGVLLLQIVFEYKHATLITQLKHVTIIFGLQMLS